VQISAKNSKIFGQIIGLLFCVFYFILFSDMERFYSGVKLFISLNALRAYFYVVINEKINTITKVIKNIS